MEFFISQNATLPILKMELNFDGKSSIEDLNSFIAESSIFFSMKNLVDGNFKILNKKAGFVNKTFIEPNSEPEYYVYYVFNSRDTNTVGKFEGEFLFRADEGSIILPIREKLYINITETLVK
jgi:hypothetical protein